MRRSVSLAPRTARLDVRLCARDFFFCGDREEREVGCAEYTCRKGAVDVEWILGAFVGKVGWPGGL